jgi:glycosidase
VDAAHQQGLFVIFDIVLNHTGNAYVYQYGPGSTIRAGRLGDNCAWVGDGLQIPGAPFNMIGNDGDAYPVHTLWSNQRLSDVGYCSQGF